MPKILTRLATVLAAVWCVGEAALAQPRTGVGAAPAPHVSAPAPHISAPTPHISAPAIPHVSTPTPHIAPTPHINVAPRIATPHFSPRGATVHPFPPRGHGGATGRFARPTIHGPTGTWHALERGAGRSARRSASRAFAGRDLRHRRTGDLARERAAFARDRSRTGGSGRLATDRTRITEPGHRPRAEAGGRHRLSGAQFAALSRPLGERNRNDHDRHRWFHERRRFHHGGFVGWFGPVFWPTAYDDFFDYAFWPAEYDAYGFWSSAYDDVLANVFFSPGTEDISPSVGAERRGRGAKRRGKREGSPATDFCRVDPGLTRWPVEEIARVVEPTGEQQNLLADLKAASERAGKLLQSACPAKPPATPLGRLDGMAKRLDAMLQALDVVRPALAKFYDSLSDEQKARFNAMGREQAVGGAQAKDEARLCGTQAPAGLTEEAIDRIEQEVRPDDRQRAELDALRDATAKAADELRNACPAQTPITPVARLDAMAKRIAAMRDAINTVRPALARFYDSLTDEQKAHFNVMARNQ